MNSWNLLKIMIDRPENFLLPLLCKAKIGCGQARGSLCSFFHVILKSYHIWVLQVSRQWGVGYKPTHLWLTGFLRGSFRSNQLLQRELIFLLIWHSISIIFIMWYLHLYWYCIRKQRCHVSSAEPRWFEVRNSTCGSGSCIWWQRLPCRNGWKPYISLKFIPGDHFSF